MKKKIFLFAVVLALLVSVSPAFALQCKSGNTGSDECWTTVQIGDGYPTLVSRGHVLVVSMGGVTVDDNDGVLARHARTSTDNMVAGVAQNPITTGDRGMVLVRGRGVVNLADADDGASVTSGDPLMIAAGIADSTYDQIVSGNVGAVVSSASYTYAVTNRGSVIGESLETQAVEDTANWAYIDVL